MVILPKGPRSLGESVGQGLGSGIEKLAQMKLDQIHKSHERSRLAQSYAKIPGITPEQGYLLADMPEQHRMDILRELATRNQEDQWRQQQMQGNAPQIWQPSSVGQSGFQNFMGQMPQQQGGMPQGYGMQPQQRIPFQNPQLAWQQQKFQQQLQQNQQKQQKMTQAQIDRRYSKFQDNIEKEAAIAEDIKFKAQQALQLIAGGGTSQRLGGYTPTALMNEQTADLEKIYNEIAFKKAQEGTGIMSRMKIIAAAATKPSLKQPIKTQIALLNDLINEQDRRGLGLSQITNEIIDANGGVVPEGLDRLVRKEYHQRFGTGSNARLSADLGKTSSTVDQARSTKSEPYNSEDEDILSKGVRLGIGGASRVATGLVSGPGDIVKMGANVADYAASKFGKNLGAGEAVEKYSPLPTSEGVAKKISEFTKGYTDPKSYAEDFGYRVLDTFGAFFMPQKAAGKVAQLLGKAGVSATKAQKAENIILPFSGYVGSKKRLLGQAAAMHAAGDVVTGLGGGPALQTAAQVGGFLLAGSAGTRAKLTKDTTALYNEVKAESKDIPVDVRRAIPKLEAIKEEAIKNATEHKDEIAKITNRYIDAMEKEPKAFPLSNIVGQIQSTNDLFKLPKEQRVSLEATTPEAIRPYLHDIREVLNETIDSAKNISSKANDLVTKYQVANDNWRGLNTHGKATQFLIDHADQFGHGGTKYHFVFNLLKGGLALIGRDIAKVQSLLRTSVGQKAYLEAIDAAAAGNMSKFKRAYNTLIAIAKKEGIE